MGQRQGGAGAEAQNRGQDRAQRAQTWTEETESILMCLHLRTALHCALCTVHCVIIFFSIPGLLHMLFRVWLELLLLCSDALTVPDCTACACADACAVPVLCAYANMPASCLCFVLATIVLTTQGRSQWDLHTR
jgi:hypothetical protein